MDLDTSRTMAEGTGERVAEVTARRTVQSKTYRLDNGQLETVIGAAPLHWRGRDGVLVDLDTALRSGRDGLRPVSSPRQVSVPSSSAGMVAVDGLTVTLADAREVAGSLDGQGRVTFPDVLDSVAWRVWSHAAGVGADLVLAGPVAVASTGGRIDYRVGGVDTKPEVTATGAVRYGETHEIGAPFARDAAGAEAEAVWEVTDGGLTMLLPVEWLQAEGRVWPVVVDPDVVTLNTTAEVDDTYLVQASPTGNRGYNWGINIAPSPSVNRGLLAFDVRGAFSEPVRVSEAYIGVTIGANVASTGSTQIVNAYELDQGFDEGTATWNNAATGTAWTSAGGDFSNEVWSTPNLDGATAGTKVKLHLPDLAQRWLDNDEDVAHGVLLQHANEANTASTATTVNFASSQNPTASYRPELVITWNPLTGMRSNETSVPFDLAPGVTAQVNVASGSLHIAQTDHSLPGRGNSVAATRFYNSRGLYPVEDAGYGWSVFPSNYSRLQTLASGDRILYGAGFGDVRFSWTGDPAEYGRPVGMVADLDTSGTDATLTFPESGAVWTFDGPSGRLETMDDGNGNTITVAYQSADPDRVDTVTHDDGNALTYTWFADHLLDTITDNSTLNGGNGRQTVYGYPNGGNGAWKLTSFTDRGGNVTSYGHDSSNRITYIVDAEGNKTRIGYDTDGRVTGIDRDAGSTYNPDWSFAYGAAPSGTQETSANSDDRTATWKTTVTDPNSNSTRFLLSRRGDVLRTIDGEGYNQDGGFNARGFRVSQYAPDGATSGAATQYDYNANDSSSGDTRADSLSSITSPAGNTTSYSYDAATYASAPYDPISAETKNTDGTVLSQTTAQYADTVNAGPGRPSRTTSLVSDDGTTQKTVSTDYEYTAAGQLAKVTKPGNAVTTYYHADDADPWLDRVVPPSPLGSVTYTHDTTGRLASVTDGNGDTTSYTYDLQDRITTVTYDNGDTLNDVYDDVGNLTSRTLDPVVGADQVTSYTYDGFNRIATEAMPGRTATTYTYDVAGNLTAIAGAASASYSYDGRNLVDTVSTASGTADDITFTHDAAGRRTQIAYPGGLAIDTGYDDTGRVSTIDAVRGSTTYIDLEHFYDADMDGDPADDTGQLVRQNVGHDDARWDYTYDLAGQLTDRQGSILALVDDAGTIGTEYTYGPWGNTLSTSGTDRSGYRWLGTLGYHTDDTTGLIKAGARYYHPDLRRWTQQDPSALGAVR